VEVKGARPHPETERLDEEEGEECANGCAGDADGASRTLEIHSGDASAEAIARRVFGSDRRRSQSVRVRCVIHSRRNRKFDPATLSM